MFTPEMLRSIEKVEATRAARLGVEPRRMSAQEKDDLLRQYHPDYKEQTLIRGAVRHLNSGGELRIVANAFLPYPDVLDETFGFHEVIAQTGRFNTNKWPGETQREWGRPIKKDPAVTARIDAIWDELAIFKQQ